MLFRSASDAEDEAVQKPLLTDADMPDIESLGEESDYSGFMSSGVSDELRNLALRKLFKSPSFNIRDGLDEYDEDYTYFEKLGDIVTSDMKHEIEMQEQKLREALEQEQQEDLVEDEETVVSVEDDDAAEELSELDPEPDLLAEPDPEESDEQR